MDGDRNGTSAPLVRKGFEKDHRPYNDVPFTVFYTLMMLATGGLGVYVIINATSEWYDLFKREYLVNPEYCGGVAAVTRNDTELLGNLQIGTTEEIITALKENSAVGGFMNFLKHSWPWLLGAVGGAIVLGFVFLMLFSYCAAGMVYMTVSLLVLIPTGGAAYLIFDERYTIGGILVGVAVLFLILILCLRTQLNLVAKVLDVGADAIRENIQLVFFAVVSLLVSLLVVALLGLLGVITSANGEFEANSRSLGYDADKGVCYRKTTILGNFEEVACCKWNGVNWAIPFYVFLAIMALWNCALVAQLREYVVSGVVGQWYFADEGDIHVSGKTRRSLGHALGPSFGTIVVGSIIMTIGGLLRKLSEKLKNDNEDNCCLRLVNCCVQGIIAVLEFLTEFANVHAAITGESFWESGKDAIEMFKRNFINAFTIWWIPPIILGMIGALLSVVSSSILYFAARTTWDDDVELGTAKKWALYLAVITAIMILLVMLFFSTIMLDAVSAVFVCFSIDRDNQQETRGKVHEVMGMMCAAGTQSDEKAEKKDGPYEPPTAQDPPAV